MRKFSSLFQQDLKIFLRNGFHWIIIGSFGLMILVAYLIPENGEIASTQFFYDSTVNKGLEKYLRESGVDESNLLHSEEDLKASVESTKNSVGIIISERMESTLITVLHQGTIANENLKVIYTSLENMIAEMIGLTEPGGYRLELLREQALPVLRGKSLTPVFIVFGVVVFSFLIISIMIFQAKQERSIQAYKVSPGRALPYITSKTSLFLLIAFLYGNLLALAILGIKVNYLQLSIFLILGSLLMTLLGLTISVFFNNISEWILIGILVLAISLLPLVSYVYPSFAYPALTWIPSYSIVSAVREILFPTGKTGFILPEMTPLLLENLVMAGVSYWAVQKGLMKAR